MDVLPEWTIVVRPDGPTLYENLQQLFETDQRGCGRFRPSCRSDSPGCQARELAGGTAAGLRAGHQPKDRQGARPHDPALCAGAGGSSDRMTFRDLTQRRRVLFTMLT